ncbi:hypothetical protein ACI2L1_43890 [Streptomyces sp. NPDC019531]|uniref:hypothetical protein n=1 Tax=Streptomyces sp. NPDC019531 TaxID=3365062 RepID=UPI003850DFE3
MIHARDADRGHGIQRIEESVIRMPDPVPDAVPGLGAKVDAHPAVRSIGVPRAGLPHVDEVRRQLRTMTADAGVSVAEDVWEQLPQRLLSNYRYLVQGHGEFVGGGLLVPLGPAEALISLDPRDPREVLTPEASYDSASAVRLEPAGLEAAGEDAPAASADSAPATRPGPVASSSRPPRWKPSLETIPEGDLLRLEPPRWKPRLETFPEPDGPRPGPLVEPRAAGRERFYANQTTNASYMTGAHVQSHSGSTKATRAAISASGGIGLSPGVLNVLRVGAGVSGTANVSSRSTNRIGDAEGGHVEDTRADSKLLSYTPGWSLRIRTDSHRHWSDIEPVGVGTETERLMLWVPEHYLERAPEQITATGTRGLERRLPPAFYASGLTNLPALFDQVVEVLKQQGVTLEIGSSARDELLQKIWNLDAHLDEAVGDRLGYPFVIAREGRPIAAIRLHAERRPSFTRVGATSDAAHLENVRTAIDGTGGSHTVGQSSSVTFPAATLDLLPLPFTKPFLTAHAGLSLSATWSSAESISAGRTGLWVLVPRFTGRTSAHEVQFTLRAVVSVRGAEKPVSTAPVDSQGLIRVPEPAALKYGFQVDLEALKDPAPVKERAGIKTVAYQDDLLRGSGREDGDPQNRSLPRHVREGHGIGMGLVEVEEGTVRYLHDQVTKHLVEHGFVPPDPEHPLEGSRWWTYGNTMDGQVANHQLMAKYFSLRGFESFYDQIHQSGLVFTLFKPRGAAGVNFDMDAVRITIKAEQSPVSPRYEGTTDNYHAVNLAMGMGSAGQSSSGGKRISLSVGGSVGFKKLIPSGVGFEVFRQVQASQGVSYLHNRPELLEYPGVLHKHRLYSTYTVTLEFQHSGLQGVLRQGARDPQPIRLVHQPSLAYLLPLGDTSNPGAHGLDHTPASVLNQAVVYYLDATGLLDAVTPALRPLTGPQGNADAELSTFTSTIMIRAHLKEITNNSYTSDQFFDPGLLRDGIGAVDISGRMGPAQFAGATKDKFVIGVIHLMLAQTNTSGTTSWGARVVAPDVTFGGPTDGQGVGHIQGGMDAAGSRQWNTSAGNGRTGGKELIQLDFNRAYAFRTTVDFEVRTRLERDGKFVPLSHHSDTRDVDGRTALFLLSEPVALEEYGKGNLPVPDEQIVDVLNRWNAGETRLSGDTVASVLTRWAGRATQDQLRQLDVALPEMARTLGQLHDRGALTVLDEKTRDDFQDRFGLAPLKDPDTTDFGKDFALPEYLTRKDPGGRILGHSGVTQVTYDEGGSTYDMVREQIDRVAPGLLASKPDLWTGDGRRLGRLQGSVNALQALFAPGRDMAFWEEFLSVHGQTFYLVNPVGWLLSDIVELKLSDVLTSPPQLLGFRPETGLENYGHGYVGRSVTRSVDTSRSVTVGKLGGGVPNSHEQSGIGLGEGSHRGVTRAENAVTEQTTYAWDGHYQARFRHTMTVEARRLDMAGRPLNNLLVGWYRNLDTDRSTAQTISRSGYIDLQIPRGLGEFKPRPEPTPGVRDLRPLPPMPGDVYVAGVLMDEALPAGLKLMVSMFGKQADGANVRTSSVVRQLLGRSQLANHLLEASAGRKYLVADNLFIPGHSSRRAKLWMTGDLFDLQVLGEVAGSGTGRYSKHQSGTTHSASTDRWRANANISSTNAGLVHAHDPATTTDGLAYPGHTSSGNTSQSLVTSNNLAGAGTENYRREAHVKQQGPVLLVRARGRYRLLGELSDHHLLSNKPTRVGDYGSDVFTGDVYMHLFEGEFAQLRARIEAAEGIGEAPDANWGKLAHAQSFDVSNLLRETAAAPGATPERAYQGVARLIRKQTDGPLDAAVLRYTALVAGSARETGEIPAGPGNPDPAPLPTTPDEHPFPSLPPQHLAREIAHELDIPVRMDLTLPDGTVARSWWADSSGRVHGSDPTVRGNGGEPELITAEGTQRAWSMPPELRSRADESGLDQGRSDPANRTSPQQGLPRHETAEALRLLAGADSRLLDASFTGGAEGRERLAGAIRSAVLSGIAPDGRFPALLMGDSAFQSQAEQIRATLAAEGTLAETDPAVTALLRRAAELVDTVQAMAARALGALPPVAAPVWWGTWASGPLDGDAPGPKAISVPRFQPVSLDKPTTGDILTAPWPQKGEHHFVFVEVDKSSARDISPFSDLAGPRQARYADDTVLEVRRREVRRDELTGLRYEYLWVREQGGPGPDASGDDGLPGDGLAGDGPGSKGPDTSGPHGPDTGGPGPRQRPDGGAGPDNATPEPPADRSPSGGLAPADGSHTDPGQPGSTGTETGLGVEPVQPHGPRLPGPVESGRLYAVLPPGADGKLADGLETGMPQRSAGTIEADSKSAQRDDWQSVRHLAIGGSSQSSPHTATDSRPSRITVTNVDGNPVEEVVPADRTGEDHAAVAAGTASLAVDLDKNSSVTRGRWRLPVYLERMRAAGPAEFHSPVGLDWVEDTIRTLTGRAAPDLITDELRQWPGRFVGAGKSFHVRGGDGWYDVTVAMVRHPKERRPLITSVTNPAHVASAVTAGASTSLASSRSAAVSQGFSARGAGMVLVPTPTPGLLAGAIAAVSLAFGRRTVSTASSQGFADSRKSEHESGTVDVPRRVQWVVTSQKAGVSRGRVFHGEGSAVARVPVEHLVKVGERLAEDPPVPVEPLVKVGERPAEHPEPITPEEARGIELAESLSLIAAYDHAPASEPTSGLHRAVSSVLHPALTAPGSSGRSTVMAETSPDSVLRTLATAFEGWTDSPDLSGRGDSVRGGYRMRAQITALAPVSLVGDTKLKNYQKFSQQDATQVGMAYGGEVAVGPLVGVGLMSGGPRARFFLQPGLRAARSRAVSHSTAVQVVQGAQISGAKVLYEARVRIAVEGTAPVPLRARTKAGARPGEHELTVWLSLRLEEAKTLGLKMPPGVEPDPLFRSPGFDRHLPAGVRGAGTVLGRVDTGPLVQRIEELFATDERLAGFLPRFGKAAVSPGFFERVAGFLPRFGKAAVSPDSFETEDDRARQRANHRALTQALSPRGLRTRKGMLLTTGIPIRLRRNRWDVTESVLIRVEGTLVDDASPYLGDTDDWKVVTARGVSTGGQSGGDVEQGATARLAFSAKPIPGHLYFSGALTVAKNTARGAQAGPSASRSWFSAGPSDASAFEGSLRFKVTITSVEVPRTWRRRTTPGLPGQHTPEVTTVASTDPASRDGVRKLDIPDVPVRLSTPASMTSRKPLRGKLRASAVSRPLPVPPISGIGTLFDPQWAPLGEGQRRLTEWLLMEAAADPRQLQDLARRLLARAAGGDTALSTPGLDPALTLEERMSDESIVSGLPRALKGVWVVDGLRHDRRWNGVAGAVGIRFNVVNPSVVHVAEGPEVESSVSGQHSAASVMERAVAVGVGMGVFGAGDVPPQAPEVWLLGGPGASYGARWSAVRRIGTSGAIERIGISESGSRVVLVQADLEVLMVAEASVRGGNPRVEAEGTTLDGSVMAWLTEQQALSLRLGPQIDERLAEQARIENGASVETTAEVALGALEAAAVADATAVPAADATAVPAAAPAVDTTAVPAAAPAVDTAAGPAADPAAGLELPGTGPLGPGRIDRLPDFGGLLPRLRAELDRKLGTKLAQELLPNHVVRDTWRNTQRLAAVLDPIGAAGLLSSALDGGTPVELFRTGSQGAYVARFVVSRGTGTFEDRPADRLEMAYVTSASFDEAISLSTTKSSGISALALPVVPIGDTAGMSAPPLSGELGRADTPARGDSRSRQIVAMTVAPGSADYLRFRVPLTDARLDLYAPGADVDAGAEPLLSVSLDPDDRYVLYRVLESDARAMAALARERSLVPPGWRLAARGEPLETWRMQGASLPPGAQVASVEGVPLIRTALADMARNMSAYQGFTTTGTAQSYVRDESLTAEWLTASLPVLAKTGARLPDVYMLGARGGQELRVSLHARLTGGEILTTGERLYWEYSDGFAPGTARLVSADHSSSSDGSNGANWSGGGSWLRYRHNDLHDYAVTGGMSSGAHTSTSASASSGGDSQVILQTPYVLVSFEVDLRLIATLKRSVRAPGFGDPESTDDTQLRLPRRVAVRMTLESALKLVAAGAVTDPRRHLDAVAPEPVPEAPWHSTVLVRPILDADGEVIGTASFTQADWERREAVYQRLNKATEYVEQRAGETGEPVPTTRPLPLAERNRYWLAMYGSENRVTVVTTDGTRDVDDGETTALLRAYGDLATVPLGSVIVLLKDGPGRVEDAASSTSGEREAGRSIPVARRIAAATGLTVIEPVGALRVSGADDGAARIELSPSPDGGPAHWRIFRPGDPEPQEYPAAVRRGEPRPTGPDSATQPEGAREPEEAAAQPPEAPEGHRFRHEGPETVSFEGHAFRLQPPSSDRRGFGSALLQALSLDAPHTLRALPGVQDELSDDASAPLPATAADILRTWLDQRLTDGDIPADLPTPESDERFSLDELAAAGYKVGRALRTQAELMGGMLTFEAAKAGAEAGPVQRYRLLMARSGLPETVLADVLAPVVARELGVRLVLAGPGDGRVREFGAVTAQPVLLVLAGGGYRAAARTDRHSAPARRSSAAPVRTSRPAAEINGPSDAGDLRPADDDSARLVADPAPLESWLPRRSEAPVAYLRTERFDPARDPIGPGAAPGPGRLDGAGTLIRAEMRRIQAHNGQWVREFTIALPTRPADGLTADDVPALQSRLQAVLDRHINIGYELPRSGDQLHMTVRLDHDPQHDEHITLSDVRPPRADQLNWNVNHADSALVHELLHYAGLPDEYTDSGYLFRRAPNSSAVREQGLMASGDDFGGPLPFRYAKILEAVSDSGPVIRDHGLGASAAPSPPAPARGLGALIGDVTPPADQHPEQSSDDARMATTPVPRASVRVDPLSLPQPAGDIDPTTAEVLPHMPADPTARPTTDEPTLVPFRSGNFEFTNLKHTDDRYRDKAVRVIELLRKHATIRSYIDDRPCRITLLVRTTEMPANVRDRGTDGVDIELASYYFENYDIGYVMGMLSHEIGLRPLASRNTGISDEELMFQGAQLAVPGLSDLRTPRTMSTEGAGQDDHIMAAFPSSTRHRIYRGVVMEMGQLLARDAANGEVNAKAKDVTDLFDCYLMDLASIAVTNDHRMNAVTEPGYTARVYNAYKEMLRAQLAHDASLLGLLPSDKSMFGVINDFRRIGTNIAINNRGDSIQQPPRETVPAPRLSHADLLDLGNQVIAEVRARIRYGAANQIQALAANGVALSEMLAVLRDGAYRQPVSDPRTFLGQTAAAAETIGVGNCGEHAAMSFCLVNMLQLPADLAIWYVDLNLRQGEDPDTPIAPYTDHVFIAVGYVDDPLMSVVIDPWQIDAEAVYAKDFNFPLLVLSPNGVVVNPRAEIVTPDGVDYIALGRNYVDMEFFTNLMDLTGEPVDPQLLVGLPGLYDVRFVQQPAVSGDVHGTEWPDPGQAGGAEEEEDSDRMDLDSESGGDSDISI